MKRTARYLLSFAALVMSILPVHAAIVGPAADYGVFVFVNGNFQSQNTDSGGSIAAGGNVNLMNYSVASAIAGNPASSPNPARLVVGNNLTAVNGGVGNGQNGAIYIGGTSSLTSFTASGGTFGQTLVDFAAAQTLYTSLSSTLAGFSANGSTLTQFGTLTLTGANTNLNVFALSASDITSTNTVNITAPAGSTVLINVTGNGAIFQNGQVSINGTSSAYVLYNFVNATSVTLAGSKDPMGTILAPYAGVEGNYGAMHGQLITGSYDGIGTDPYGHTEFYDVKFQGNLTPVPLPAAVWLLLSGIGALGATARRRRTA